MMVGHFVKREDGLWGGGGRGLAYDYIMAGNGVWVESEGPLLAARVQVAAAVIKDLPPLEPKVVLRHGPIPGFLFKLALDAMLAHPTLELYTAVVWEGGEYHLKVPGQVRSEGGLHDIQLPPNRVLDLHSHANMSAFFSGTDNHDEQGFQLYGVVGKLLEEPEIRLRVGLYGHFQAVRWGDVFTGPHLAMDMNDEREEER
ncbi:MAG: hypothetical protein Q8O76_00150 [Chloroflexota bacterium]|nr:hypothetical protein [Chloroflexota bacterium]